MRAYDIHGGIFYLECVLQRKYDDNQIMVKNVNLKVLPSAAALLPFMSYEREGEWASVTQVYSVSQEHQKEKLGFATPSALLFW